MKKQWMLLAVGSNYTNYRHDTLQGAVKEARRLYEKLKVEIQILEVIGRVTEKEIPITRKEVVCEFQNKIEFEDDLPF